ncbi:hypothetical protein BKA70DRAFT_1248334 [Coprinopsis sp. MPI-PUGE-AT-0042]|nr:hypothetical protein BKA70DRAFT_1248334 [Coprinopsis sp. MPI-PUGE-AT-0042]
MATTAALPSYMLPGVSVHQPPHLEGDAALATEILPGPPSLVSAQQSVQKRDPKKPSTMYSYLPASDPGSTYSGVMHGTLVGLEEPRSKRPRADKGASGRAQRASARNQSATAAPLDPSPSTEHSAGIEQQLIASEPVASGSGAGDDAMVLSRSDSSLNVQDPSAQPPTIKVGKKDKGKGKETGTPPETLRSKDDAKAASSLPTPEPTSNLLNNNDHCSACRSSGSLVYCDGCPKAFHLWCLDPPMESIDEGDSRWYCPACVIRKHPPRKPPPSLLGPLIHQLELSTPVEFQLPDDIRNFFRDVSTSARGTYVDLQEAKPPRTNRHGVLVEDRDPHRLKDKNGAPVLCFQCGMSALPTGLASTVPASKRPRRSTSKAVTPEAFKDILSCDFCNLHWHLDCLNPPLSSMPPFNRKWMCPNHAEKLIPSKRRIPKQNAPPIDISKPKQWNNGYIDVIQPEPSAESKAKVQADEVLINGRRYRVPEKIIILDFWNKVSKVDLSENKDVDMGADSGLSSPLTSLSSLEEDLNERLPARNSDHDVLRAAQALFDFAHSKPAPAAAPERPAPVAILSSLPSASSTAAPTPTTTTSSRPSRGAKKAATLKITSVINAGLNGAETPATSVPRETAPTVSVSVRRRGKRTQPVTALPTATASANGARRSRSSNLTQESSSSAPSAKTGAALNMSGSSSAKPAVDFRTISVKMEEDEVSLSSTNASSTNMETGTSSTSRRRVVVRKGAATAATKPDVKPKRGRKRKATDDELPEPNAKSATGTDGKRARKASKDAADKPAVLVSTPSRPRTPSSSSGPASPLTPLTTTPKLKIRLPRLNGSATRTAGPSLLNGNADTPTRL